MRRIVTWMRQRPLVPLAALACAAAVLAGLLAHSCARPEPAPPPAPAPAPPAPSPSGRIRVLLAGPSAGQSLELDAPGGVYLLPAGGPGPWTRLPSPVRITAGDDVVTAGSGHAGPELLLAAGGGTALDAGGRRYAGIFVVRPAPGGGLAVVNDVDLEIYLHGVLGGEMPASWTLEALKAQAVAARTYAVSRRADAAFRGAPFDVYDDTRSQVYVGLPEGPTAPRLVRAVGETEGEVLVYEGTLVTAFFHSTCGGHTEAAARVLGGPSVPPLAGVPCTGCGESPAFSWEAVVERPALEAALEAVDVSSIEGLEPGPSGRFQKIRVVAGEGGRTLPAAEFRRRVGTGRLKSTAFETTVGPETFLFKGRGFGHGAGLCQWGARGLAREGKNYLAILRHYYPGALVLQAAVLAKGP